MYFYMYFCIANNHRILILRSDLFSVCHIDFKKNANELHVCMCRKNYLHQMTLMKIRIWSYMMMNLMQEFCLQYNTIYRDPWLLSNVHMFRRLLRYEWFTPHPTQISLKVNNECTHNFIFYFVHHFVYFHIFL